MKESLQIELKRYNLEATALCEGKKNSDKFSYCTPGFKNEGMTLLFMRVTVGKVQK